MSKAVLARDGRKRHGRLTSTHCSENFRRRLPACETHDEEDRRKAHGACSSRSLQKIHTVRVRRQGSHARSTLESCYRLTDEISIEYHHFAPESLRLCNTSERRDSHDVREVITPAEQKSHKGGNRTEEKKNIFFKKPRPEELNKDQTGFNRTERNKRAEQIRTSKRKGTQGKKTQRNRRKQDEIHNGSLKETKKRHGIKWNTR